MTSKKGERRKEKAESGKQKADTTTHSREGQKNSENGAGRRSLSTGNYQLSTAVSPFSFPLSLVDLARWHSAIGAGITVWVGGHLAGAAWQWGWLYPMAIAVLLSAAGNASNDAGDVEADTINRPTRPIPRGSISVNQARIFALVCATLAFLMAIPLGWATLLGTIVGVALLFGYTPYLKSIPLVGNGVVGLLVGMCVGFGGLLAGNIPAVILPGIAVGLLFGGREILKTLYDITGDSAMGVATIATRWGERATLILASLCFGGAIIPLGIWAGNSLTLWLAPFFTTLLVLATILPLWQQSTRPIINRALRGSKIVGFALLALLAFL